MSDDVRRTIYIDLVASDPRLDIWCDRCLTSAACEVDCFVLGEDGLSLTGTWTHCLRCDGEVRGG